MNTRSWLLVALLAFMLGMNVGVRLAAYQPARVERFKGDTVEFGR